ncbi:MULTISPECIES: ABC transporter substrate-binding protein [unclassified Chelatococcus]|uniref:ABC transporter substrate-binding protein n=1 Tax=unclassified Chelatococcus TaxID=2638111 RepID=UPI001BCB0E85|nr:MULTISPECIES: ABC transporter substrate-binding protein [unclassified Chelatococcus]MBS7700581.1 ABC transporter substrate-binding protein [Chelatococcus sp. YT9]MBX3558696.1 ABC transporter substrate-binding protein [Chelatococcus sp.]
MRALVWLCFAAGALAGAADAKANLVLQDAAGRTVRLKAPAQRIVTNESLILLSLALIDPDPVSRLAGWAGPRRIGEGILETFRQRFPAVDAIPVVGGVSPSNTSVEGIISAKPDLFLINLWQPDWTAVAELVETAGIPVLFLDGPANADRPIGEATAFSIELLGRAIGQEDNAKAYAALVRSRYARVAERLAGVTKRPGVLVDAHATEVCCATPGAGNRMTQMLELAGARNIGAGQVAGYDGVLSPEFVLAEDPDVYIATGGPHLAAQGGLVLGSGIGPEAARASFQKVVTGSMRSVLPAVRRGRAFAISHQLAISALNVVVFELFAKWSHPEVFGDVDPRKTLDEINRRFMAVPLQGALWVGLLADPPTTP